MTSPTRSVAVLLAFAAGLLGTSVTSAQVLFHASDFQVYDATDKRVGTVSNSAGNPMNGLFKVEVLLRTGTGHNLFLNVFRSRIEGSSGWLWFRSENCTGEPLVSRGDSSREPIAVLIGPRRTVYAQVGTMSPATIRSARQGDGQCVRTTEHVGQEFAPAARLGIDVADYFTPPFALRATAGEPVPIGAVAEPLESTDRIVVFDSTGKKVATAAAYAVVTDSGITIPMSGMDWLVWALYFESTDCSGAPFLHTRGEGVLAGTSAVGPRKTVYLRSEDPQRRRMYSSSAFPGGECFLLETRISPSQVVPGRPGHYAAAAPIGIDLVDYFTPPFTARAGRGTNPLPRPN